MSPRWPRSAICTRTAATRKYRLGPRVLDLGFSAINSMELREIAAPHLQELSDETGHTVNMAILDGDDIVYIERCPQLAAGPARDRPEPARRLAPAGVLHVDGQGAARPPPRRSELARRPRRGEFAQRGPNTLTEPRRRSLGRARPRVATAGIAVNNEELAYGLRSIAAPVRSQSGEAIAAINLAVHRSMVSMEDMVARLGPPLDRTAVQISSRIGHRPAAPR